MADIPMLMERLAVPRGRVDAVLDTDTYNEIDDQFALAYMLKCGRIDVQAIYAAPFFNENSSGPADGMEKSYQEILRLLGLMDRKDMAGRVLRGSEKYLPDEKTPVDSPATRALAELASSYSPERPLYVVAIGAITNVASALLMRPEIKDNIVVVWLGGHGWHCGRNDEFNLRQDVAAARVVFGCGTALVQLPCMGVVSELRTTGPELEHWLRGKNALCDYLASNTIAAAEKYAKGKAWSRVIWDVAAVAWLLGGDGRFMRSRIEPTPVPEYDDLYAFPPSRTPMRYVAWIDRDALFYDLFTTLAK